MKTLRMLIGDEYFDDGIKIQNSLHEIMRGMSEETGLSFKESISDLGGFYSSSKIPLPGFYGAEFIFYTDADSLLEPARNPHIKFDWIVSAIDYSNPGKGGEYVMRALSDKTKPIKALFDEIDQTDTNTIEALKGIPGLNYLIIPPFKGNGVSMETELGRAIGSHYMKEKELAKSPIKSIPKRKN